MGHILDRKHTGAIGGDHIVDELCRHTINDPITDSRNKMSIGIDMYIILYTP